MLAVPGAETFLARESVPANSLSEVTKSLHRFAESFLGGGLSAGLRSSDLKLRRTCYSPVCYRTYSQVASLAFLRIPAGPTGFLWNDSSLRWICPRQKWQLEKRERHDGRCKKLRRTFKMPEPSESQYGTLSAGISQLMYQKSGDLCFLDRVTRGRRFGRYIIVSAEFPHLAAGCEPMRKE